MAILHGSGCCKGKPSNKNPEGDLKRVKWTFEIHTFAGCFWWLFWSLSPSRKSQGDQVREDREKPPTNFSFLISGLRPNRWFGVPIGLPTHQSQGFAKTIQTTGPKGNPTTGMKWTVSIWRLMGWGDPGVFKGNRTEAYHCEPRSKQNVQTRIALGSSTKEIKPGQA